jgi:hypothetical protein
LLDVPSVSIDFFDRLLSINYLRGSIELTRAAVPVSAAPAFAAQPSS